MLSFRTLPLRSLAFHWATQLPVLLGVAVGAAVLTGALVVGDSLRSSLRARAEKQLNGVQTAWVGERLIREEAVRGLPETTPLLLLNGSARTTDVNLGRVAVVGMADDDRGRFGLPNGVVLSHRVADRLGVKETEFVWLGLEKGSRVPRASLVGKRDVSDVTATLKLRVDAVLPPDHGMNEFTLSPSPAPPLNVFVPLALLQKQLELPSKVNAAVSTSADVRKLDTQLHAHLTPADRGLRILPGDKFDSDLRAKAFADQGYVLVESENSILDSATLAAIEEAAAKIGARSERTLSYLANAISKGTEKIANTDKDAKTPLMGYAIVSVVDPTAPAPLGPFLPKELTNLADDEIALLDWPESPLPKLTQGDPVTLAFFKPEMEASVQEEWRTFRFAGYVPFEKAAADPNLTPPFPGVTDKPKIRQWEAPFEVNYSRVTPADDTFWEKHQATPKAYIKRTAERSPFASRFGEATSVRIAPPAGKTREQTADDLRKALKETLKPAAAGLVFQPIREQALAASSGGTDFAAMLLAFSGLLILAALLLVAMLFRLAVDRRAKEVGLLLAAGYTPKQTRLLLVVEGFLVSVIGATIGAGLAVLYAGGMLKFLAWLWPDANVGGLLTVRVHAGNLVIGGFSSIVAAVFAIWLGVRKLVQVPPPSLLRGQSTITATSAKPVNAKRSLGIAAGCAVVGVGLLAAGPLGGSADQRAGTFFGGGLFLMAAGALVFRWWLFRPREGVLDGLTALGVRNTTRAASRSLLTVVLLALATFLLVSVESFRKQPDAAFAQKTGGSGGFPLLAEADIPIFHRLDGDRGRNDILTELQKVYQDQEGDLAGKMQAAEDDLKTATVFPFRLKGGDDASCLNLQAAARPRVVGAPDELLADRRFAFAMSEAKTDDQKANPWWLLNEPTADNSVPVILEINTALWQLKTFLGGTIRVPDGNGAEVKLRVVGLLQDSVFQSELIVSDANFRKLYPLEEGYRLFLIDTPAEKRERVGQLLETGLRANGLTVTPTADRVRTYQEVIGAYLSTFQLLGGLGLLIGILGLAAVMFRAIWERAGELALLRAVGYQTGELQRIVLIENVVLLLVGVGIGLAAALLSVLPNLALGGQLGSARLGVMLAAVLIVGVLVAVFTTTRTAAVPLIPALRKE
ncbi:MAG: ABC transporter permease [Fimbriiglobus sp.]|nr:ABC transporter permease [Fimbriiglobus sp.]